MQIERLEILRSIAEMAYVIAKADKGLSSEERIAFNKIIVEELQYDSWAAQSRFDLMDEVIKPSIETAYNQAIHDLRKHKEHLTDSMRSTAVRVVERVAQACSGTHEIEAFILDRFKKDLQHL
jgi:uncharacterized tellurite resistance protein B-like protein